ncbi:MAG: hypothetical protein C0459_13730 [Chitinophaga sp.]|jgi:cellulose biosynthesis protein BcsQ|nr:hypothetical protein [Chitinophaga sp.]
MKTTNKKLVQFICSGKGGVGKSILMYLLANKYEKAIILDLDINETTYRQLGFRNPVKVDLLNENQVIDRGKLNDFFEHISTHTAYHFIADCSSSLSEQLIPYVKDFGAESLTLILEDLNIELQFLVVCGGADVFAATMNYAAALSEILQDSIPMIIASNQYYTLLEKQNQQLNTFIDENNLKLINYTISNDKNLSTQNRIKQVLTSGKGHAEASIFSKSYFENAVKNLKL